MSDEEDNEEGKKKKLPLALILVGVNVLLGGGAAAFFFLNGNASAGGGGHAPAADHGEGGDDHGGGGDDHGGGDDGHGGGGGHGEDHGAVASGGPMVTFEPIVVNLNEPEGTRYLKIALSVQLSSSKMQGTVEDAKPAIRDRFIRELSDLNFRQTMGKKNKLAIKKRLLKRLNDAVQTDAAVEIHITQFIVQ